MRLVSVVHDRFPPTPTKYRARLRNGLTLSCDLRDGVQSCIFYRGVYEPAVTEFIAGNLRPGDTFLDVGANIGYFTLVASRLVGPAGRVLAFEAAADTADQLKHDVLLMGSKCANVEVHEVGAFDQEGFAGLVEPTNVASPTGERFVDPRNSIDQRVRLVRLDDYIPDLDFHVAKVDVEGAEVRVLRGLTKTIKRSTPRLIVVEAIEENLQRFDDSTHDLLELMTGLGFSVERIDSPDFAPMLAFWAPGKMGAAT